MQPPSVSGLRGFAPRSSKNWDWPRPTGTFVAGLRIKSDDSRGADDARGLLLNPLVEAAVLEASVDRILEEGLAFDRCDVAVVTSDRRGIEARFSGMGFAGEKSRWSTARPAT